MNSSALDTATPTGTRRRSRRARGFAGVLAVLAAGVLVAAEPGGVGAQESYQRISGEGSSWSANAIDDMRVNVKQFGITVDYASTGSTSGRKNWLNGTVDFAASDIPFQFEPEDGSAPEQPAAGSYAYIPVTAGGTAFMYNLRINGQQVTNLRLSGENVARIFTGDITTWDDPAIQADNPGLVMPARPIVPVVRSDGSGSTAQFSSWMIDRHPAIWQSYCERSGRAPACGSTSFYPVVGSDATVAQAGDLGVAGYVAQSFAEGAIGYVNYSYALGAEFPVAKILNAAGYFTEPTPENVAVSLLQAKINNDSSNPAVYLTQELSGVYADTDPRNYQLSSYSYFILPTTITGRFTEAKGRTLSAFAYYAMCEAQQNSAALGYSPLPINLVEASFDQIRLIPGAEVQDINVASCNNPTFSTDGTNTLAVNAPQPQQCDRVDFASQCPDGTAGKANQPTPVAQVQTGGGTTGGGATGGGATGGTTGGGAATGGTTGGAATTGGSAATTGGAQSGTNSSTSGGAVAGTGTGGATGGSSSSGNVGASGSQTSTGGSGATSGGSSTGSSSATSGGVSSGTTSGATTSGSTASGSVGGVGTTGGTSVGDTGQSGSLGSPTVAGGEAGAAGADGCDPVTGVCVEQTPVNASPTAQQQVVSPVQTTTLDQGSGWGGRQALMVVVVLFTLGLVIAPPLVWRRLSADGGGAA